MECAAAYVSDTLCAPVHTAHLNIVQTLHLAYHWKHSSPKETAKTEANTVENHYTIVE
jgi:hypothetical protein